MDLDGFEWFWDHFLNSLGVQEQWSCMNTCSDPDATAAVIVAGTSRLHCALEKSFQSDFCLTSCADANSL